MSSLAATLNSHPAGRHFLQIPGPTNVPDEVLRAIDHPTIDHRGPEFAHLGLKVLRDIKPVFGTTQPVIIYPASGTGAWEAAMVNTLSPGDTVLMVETGQFATLWKKLAERLGLVPEIIETVFRLRLESTSGEVREAVKRVALHTRGAPASRNRPPVIAAVELDRTEATPGTVAATIPPGGKVRPARTMRLRLSSMVKSPSIPAETGMVL